MNENQLRSCFEQCGPTKKQKERMMEEMEKHGEKKREAYQLRWSGMAAAAAVAACLLATTAFAAKAAGLDRRLLEFLGAGEQAEALIAGAQVVDKSVKDAGSTLTVREVLGDGNNLYILLNLTAPEGTVLDAYNYRFRDDYLGFEGQDSWQSTDCTKLEDTDLADNSLDLVLKVTTDGIPADGTVTLELSDLESAAGYGERYVPVDLPGTWKVSFPLEYTDCSRSVSGMWEAVSLYGQEAAVTEVSVSPLSVTVKGSCKTMDEAVDAARAAGVEGWFPVTLRFKDGTEFTTNSEAGDNFTSLTKRSDFYTNWTFHKVIDPEQVESVEFFGGSIPMK